MRAMLAGQAPAGAPNLHEWLEVGKVAIPRLDGASLIEPPLAPHNRLSQLNVLLQLENLRSYPVVQERLRAGTLGLHAWWFDLEGAEVLAFDDALGRFLPLGEPAPGVDAVITAPG